MCLPCIAKGVAALNNQLVKKCVLNINKIWGRSVSVFKCTEIFDQAKIGELKPTGSDVDSPQVFPLLSFDNRLKHKLPTYMTAAGTFHQQ